MKQKILLLKMGLAMMFLIAGFHTFFVITGGPPLPTTPEFLKMQHAMRSIQVDTGGGIMRTTQNFLDGFNIIVSIYLISLPLLGWVLLKEIRENQSAVRKLTIVILLSQMAFGSTSWALLAIGGTILSFIGCICLMLSLVISKEQKS